MSIERQDLVTSADYDLPNEEEEVENGFASPLLHERINEPHYGMSRTQAYNLYTSHFLSTWNVRTYEFAAVSNSGVTIFLYTDNYRSYLRLLHIRILLLQLLFGKILSFPPNASI